ncbi:hypothetical protein OIE75_40775 (plasmid) [Streptomyces sp. NBC_01723]|uniref:hypothetical protein n=1 Tax=Streptomyces sp. NBC_01723 TaxID=2975921 RepID=UPI002E2F1ABB|nr:hypothetical protein [Streptomyces sp. NBC_01723]
MIPRSSVTAGVQQLLESLTGRPVGRRTIPLNSEGKPVAPPYTILDPGPHTTSDGTLADAHTTAVSEYTATFVSGPLPGVPNSRGGDEQAQWMTDRGRKVVERPADGSTRYTHPLNIPGVTCSYREANEAGGTQDPEDGIITSVIRYRFHLEEATGA